MAEEKLSPLAAGIAQGLTEAIEDATGKHVDGLKKSLVYRIQPKQIREQLHMSQSEFAHAFGIPLTTLQGWEQGRRKVDTTTASYLRIIMKIPDEVKQALSAE